MIPKREKGEDRPSTGGTGTEPKGRHGDFRGWCPQGRRARALGRAEMKKQERWLMSPFGGELYKDERRRDERPKRSFIVASDRGPQLGSQLTQGIDTYY